MTAASATPASDLKRELTLLDAVMINAGTMIASAIFLVPADVAAAVPGVGLMTIAWVVGGAISVLGALSVAELAAAYPEAGGQYAYLREAYGPLWGFLYGWTALLVINPASIAAISVAFARYIGFFTPLSEPAIRAIAVLSIFALTLLNGRGVRLGATTQNVLTFAKIGALLVMVGAAFLLPGGSTANLSQLWPQGPVASWIGPFGVAMVAVLWAYDGWIETTYVGGEIQDPGRNLPRSIILSTLIVVALYTVVSFSFAYVLSPERMAGSKVVASDAAAVVLGGGGAAFVAAAILMSTLGSNNGQILAGPRIPYAMARGGLFFRSQAHVHPRYATPVVALLTQAVIASVLAASGTYNTLFTYVVFASFLFYGLSAAAVIRLRRRAPALERPYRAWGYPFTPLIFIAFAAWLVVSTVIETPRESAVGAGLILLGLPGYYYWKKGRTVR
ncbi:MAG TPA: amino acid permease [Gemmatimonadales bacterium]|nr:amino acid permease [Gemmatimonadales bacterium]